MKFEGFEVSFVGYSKRGLPTYRVYIERGYEKMALEWFFQRAKEALKEACRQLGYTIEEVVRKPRENLSPEKREKRRRVLRLAARIFGKYIVVTKSEKNIWYKMGLALTDGSVQGRKVEFGTTTIELSLCVLLAWSEVTIYLGDGFYIREDLVPELDFVVTITETLRRLITIAVKAPHELAKILVSDREKLHSFLGGVVDGDGCVKERVEGSKVKFKVVVICGKTKPLFRLLKALTTLTDIGGGNDTGSVVRFYIHRSLWENIYHHMEHPIRKGKLLKAINRRNVLKAFKADCCIALVSPYPNLLRTLTGKEPSSKGGVWRVYTADHTVLRNALDLVDERSKKVILEFLRTHTQKKPSRRVWSWRNRGRRLWAYRSKRTVQLCSSNAGLLRELTGREPRATRYGYYYDLRHLSAS